jgi:Sec-independent protein translocase protein TatA
MEILGVGPLEIIVILLLVILFFSPKDIAGGARTVGKNLKKIAQSDTYRVVRQVSNDIRDLPSRLIQEAELEDLQQVTQDLKKEASLESLQTIPQELKKEANLEDLQQIPQEPKKESEREAVPQSPKEPMGGSYAAKETAEEQEKPAE